MAKRIILKNKSIPKYDNVPTKVNLEIEKKFVVTDPEQTKKILIEKYGKAVKTDEKAGFWFCSNFAGFKPILEIEKTQFVKADSEVIKSITEGVFPVDDYDFLRLRVKNKKSFIITFKNKSLVDNIEKNTEYEFEIDKETARRVVSFLQERCFIFYYNIKKTSLFTKDEVSIEYSNLNDLIDPYIEVEVVGCKEDVLMETLQNALSDFDSCPVKEEPTSYVALSRSENKQTLARVTLNQYSNKAFAELNQLLADK